MAAQRHVPKSALPTGAGTHAVTGQWWMVSGGWLLLTLAVLLEEFLEYPNDPAHAFRAVSVRWLPWVFLTPGISWLTLHCRLERSTWHRTIGIYLAACVLVVGGMDGLAYLIGPLPRGERGGFGRHEHERREGMEHPREGDHPQVSDSSRAPGEPRAAGRETARVFALRLVRLASFHVPAFWIVVLALNGLRFYQDAKVRERQQVELESRLAFARLQALRMQLNPHFLFNTLNSIASLVYENPKAADDMIGSLSELLRLTLNTSDQQEVSLRQELHFLDMYLEIEQMRFGDRLKLDKQIEPAALNILVPILILQPLTENAVRHGLDSQLGACLVSVGAERRGEALLLQISDNGRGPESAEEGNFKEGVGLSNTRARLQALYGEGAWMEIRRPEGGGCVVEIRIPWRTEPAREASPAADHGA